MFFNSFILFKVFLASLAYLTYFVSSCVGPSKRRRPVRGHTEYHSCWVFSGLPVCDILDGIFHDLSFLENVISHSGLIQILTFSEGEVKRSFYYAIKTSCTVFGPTVLYTFNFVRLFPWKFFEDYRNKNDINYFRVRWHWKRERKGKKKKKE